MNKLLFLAIISEILFATAAFGQGTIDFASQTFTPVSAPGLTTNGFAPVGTEVELFYQPGGGSAPAPIFNSATRQIDLGTWESAGAAAHPTVSTNPTSIPSPNGMFSGGFLITGSDVPAHSNAWFTVVAWSGGYSDFSTAVANGAYAGESSIFELTTGATNAPTELLAAPGGLPGFVAGSPFRGIVLTPEPSTIAVGTFGAGAMLLFRRRRQKP